MKRFILGLSLAFALLFGAPAQAAYSNTVCIVSGGTSSPFTLSSLLPGWNNSDNTIHVIGGGGDSFAGTGTSGGAGGGGGAYSALLNATLSATNGFYVGVHGGVTNSTAATWVCNGSANCATYNASGTIVETRGGNSAVGTSAVTAATTGQAKGTTLVNGAASGNSGAGKGGGGGGGASGPTVGTAGGGGTTGVFGAGGQGNGSVGGAGGATAAAAGAAGAEIANCTGDVTGPVGAGGGGAGGGTVTSTTGGDGGAYGAGGGGSYNGTTGLGKNGIIIFQWNVAGAVNNHNLLLLGVGN